MRLHIGGEETKEGWKILNIQKKPGVDFIGDITDLSQFDDQSVEEVYASHILEHVRIAQINQTFKGIYRILKKSGKFYISVPNLESIAEVFLQLPEGLDKYNLSRLIYGGQIDNYDFHYTGFWPAILFSYLSNSGFKRYKREKFFNIFEDTSKNTFDGKIPISLNVIAFKD
jgi:predicted SAM-dependent methyltransferase